MVLPPVGDIRSVAADVAQQSQDLQVQPDQRDHQAERVVPGGLRRHAGLDRLLDLVEVEQEAQRRDHDDDQRDDDRHGAAVAEAEIHAEHAHHQVDQQHRHDAEHRADDHLGELRA